MEKQFGVEAIATGIITVFYFGRLIALVNENGIIWRDPNYPKYLVEWLIENHPPQYKWN